MRVYVYAWVFAKTCIQIALAVCVSFGKSHRSCQITQIYQATRVVPCRLLKLFVGILIV